MLYARTPLFSVVCSAMTLAKHLSRSIECAEIAVLKLSYKIVTLQHVLVPTSMPPIDGIWMSSTAAFNTRTLGPSNSIAILEIAEKTTSFAAPVVEACTTS